MISIIIPTLNEEKVIAATLKSLKNNLKLPYEIIISDGGSSDKTLSIVSKYTNKIAVPSSSVRQTIAAGRNAGAALATGNLLLFLDADCQLENPEVSLQTALSQFEEDPSLVALTASIQVFPSMETLADSIVLSIINWKCRIMNNYLGIAEPIGGEFQMIRRKAFHQVGGYRNDLVAYEDFNMFSRLSKIGRTVFEPGVTVFHTGRRAHLIGWPQLIFLYAMNTIYFYLFGRAYSKEWKPLR